MTHGLLMALEGIDGAGTTTQLPLLAAYLHTKGLLVHTTAEPSRGPIGLLLRQALRGAPAMGEGALALLFAADRLDHLTREVEPYLANGGWVLSDRYLMSSYAYQTSRLPLAWVQSINARARTPDVTLFFRVTPATAAARRLARGGGVEHFDAAARQERIAQLYEQALGLPDMGRTFIVDAEADIAAVTAQCQHYVDAILQGED